MSESPSERRQGMLSVEDLRELARQNRIDTVIVGMTDMQGRLQGKKCSVEFFLDEVIEHGVDGCDYLLAVDAEMRTVGGYAMSSWDHGYGDLVMRPDLGTLRLLPWHERTAIVQCDVEWPDGRPVAASPRQVLARQLERLAALDLEAFVGTELEFIAFNDTYESAWRRRYDGLTPSTHYNVDYSLLSTGASDALIQAVCTSMSAAGMYVESAKGECNLGQHEIAFRYATALTTCDNHVLYKNGAKEIAAQRGQSITFMPKFNEREGNSCHIHMSLRSSGGDAALVGQGPHGFSPLMEHFIAGQLACLRDFAYFFAPNINSYKRFVPGSFAPTALAWGLDNRTCALRVVGGGHSLRVENRVPGGDVNPYLAVAAMIAAGIHGIENELQLAAPFEGNAYDADLAHVPNSLDNAAELLAKSDVARTALGDDVVDHYVNAAQVELDAFRSAVTDWERIRGFERL